MKSKTYFRLSGMLFLLFFFYGIILPVMGMYLIDDLGYTGTQSGIIMALSATAAFIAPAVGSVIADRLISAEKLFASLLLASSFFLFLLKDVKAFLVFAVLFLAYSLFSGNTHTLANAVVFHNLKDRNEYGKIRIWGTIGWMVAAWFFGVIWMSSRFNSSPENSDAFVLASIAAFILGAAMLLVKRKTKPRRSEVKGIIPREALAIMKNPQAIKYGVIFFFAAAADRIYMYSAAPYLKSLGFQSKMILPLMTLGQFSELFLMFFLSSIVIKFGYRKVILAGSFFNMFKFLMFALPVNAFLFPGLLSHGATFTLVFPTLTILVDRFCTSRERSGVHQIYGIITAGFANIAGNISTGIVLDLSRSAGIINYHRFWLFALAVASVQLLLCIAFVKEVPATFVATDEVSDI